MDLLAALAALVAFLSPSANTAQPVGSATTATPSQTTAASQAPVLNVSNSSVEPGDICCAN